jgi:hypothetical protein
MIANYISPKKDQPAPTGSCKIAPQGDDVIKQNGGKRLFAKFYDPLGEEITTLVPNWELALPDELIGLITIANIDADNHSIILKANKNAISGATFTIKMTANDEYFGVFEAEYMLEVGDFL